MKRIWRTSDNVALPERQMRELALFAGAGGGILGGKLLGWKCVCAVEIDPYARKVLLARQADGCLEPFPVWDDVTTFDGNRWRGSVDVVSGGFPCQDISTAGKGSGLNGKRSGLWAEMVRIIGEVQPRFVLVENSPMLALRGLDRVLGDLASLGYDARWGVLGARSCGGPVERERLWIACADKEHGEAWLGHFKHGSGEVFGRVAGECPTFWLQAPSKRFGVEHGLDSYVDQVAAIGNGQVPAVVRLALRTLSVGLEMSMPNAEAHASAGQEQGET
ncbi:DNA cytosine methyltransferase [Thiocapsa sp. N5-Cardenillas]|uniref:DNA cytosine methyltransferase n=1 Tax=Thiocapsa sp. N5-Cardenillas TaxID=3137397 RepID=UPI0035B29BBF